MRPVPKPAAIVLAASEQRQLEKWATGEAPEQALALRAQYGSRSREWRGEYGHRGQTGNSSCFDRSEMACSIRR